MEKTQENLSETKEAGTIYELSYLLLPALNPIDAEAEAGKITSFVQSLGAEVVSSEAPSLIDLAYGMVKVVQTVRHKAHTGYFGWIKFALDKEEIEKVKKMCEASPIVLRYLIIKTVRENTFIAGKITFKKESLERDAVEVEEDVVEAPVASSEEIDKSIDDLVIA